jgi:hypothetical protein
MDDEIRAPVANSSKEVARELVFPTGRVGRVGPGQ